MLEKTKNYYKILYYKIIREIYINNNVYYIYIYIANIYKIYIMLLKKLEN